MKTTTNNESDQAKIPEESKEKFENAFKNLKKIQDSLIPFISEKDEKHPTKKPIEWDFTDLIVSSTS